MMRFASVSQLGTIALTLVLKLNPNHGVGDEDHSIVAAWVQYTAQGIEARAVVNQDCPVLHVDNKPVLMVQRAPPSADHPNSVCAAALPPRSQSVQLYDLTLPTPLENRPKQIVIMGDTGRRLSKKHGFYQQCNNDSL